MMIRPRVLPATRIAGFIALLLALSAPGFLMAQEDDAGLHERLAREATALEEQVIDWRRDLPYRGRIDRSC